MADKTTIDKIKNWLNSESKDKDQGLELLNKVCNHKKMVMRLQRKSNEKMVIEKIAWELMKFIPKEAPKEPEMWPPVIDRIKEELLLIFNQQAVIQKELVELGDANDEETKEKAKTLGEIAEALGIRHQLLQEAKELYFKDKVIPNEQELFPNTDPVTSADNVNNNGDGGSSKPLYKWEGDPAQAMATKKNREASLTKDRNLLLYQSKTKQENENPMPEGAERDKVLTRIADKEKELKAIIDFLKPKDDADKAE